MAKRIENWIDEIYPQFRNSSEKFGKLELRELVIVASSIFDLALAQILQARLIGNGKEIDSFLGLSSNDSHAPCGAFGPRIQLSYLLGILEQEEMALFRAFKNLRNQYAHGVNVSILDAEGQKNYRVIYDRFITMITHDFDEDKKKKYLSSLTEMHVDSMNVAQAPGIVRFVFGVLHELLKEKSEKIVPVSSFQGSL